MDVVRWPPSAEFPPTTPDEGIRGDRHGHRGLSYKIWVTASGAESAICCPDIEEPNVSTFLATIRTLADESLGSGWWAEGELDFGIDVLDAIAAPGGVRLESGLGQGAFGDGPFLSPTDLANLMIEDIDHRAAGR